MRDTIALRLASGEDIPVLRVRDPRARRLRLIVSEAGVRLTVPLRASQRLADAFLYAQRDWIRTQLAKQPARETAPPLSPEHCHSLPLRGEQWPLRWHEGRYARATLCDDGIDLHLPVADEARARAALREFYLAQARSDVGRWMPRYLAELPRAPKQFRLRPLRSLWGSLSASSALSLDLALILGRPTAFEYVLVHELCHLIEPNHSPAFWHQVSARCPQWKTERDYLRGEGLALKRTLAGLIG